jgi:hypothetical protein
VHLKNALKIHAEGDRMKVGAAALGTAALVCTLLGHPPQSHAAPSDPGLEVREESPTSSGPAAETFVVPDMPDPHSADWDPPTPPPPREAATPEPRTDGISLPEDPTPAEAAASSTEPSTRISRRGAFYTGIAFAAVGALSGAVALRSNEAAEAAQEQLKAMSNPVFPPETREGPIAEIERQNKITLAFAVAAGGCALIGATLIIVGVVPKRPRQHASIQWRSTWGIGASF